MEIAIMDYQSGTIRTIKGCPDEWQTEQIEDYLYNTLGYRESDIYYMCGTISHTQEEYITQPDTSQRTKQWNKLKKDHPGALLLFRVGRFVECYNEDAVKAAEILDITLTDRHTEHLSKIAGFPDYALDTYLPKFIRAGQRVAIYDQLEDPKLTKTLVKRSISCLL